MAHLTLSALPGDGRRGRGRLAGATVAAGPATGPFTRAARSR
ncbi:hypothetical protein [Streptomyces sp. NPDC047071]